VRCKRGGVGGRRSRAGRRARGEGECSARCVTWAGRGLALLAVQPRAAAGGTAAARAPLPGRSSPRPSQDISVGARSLRRSARLLRRRTLLALAGAARTRATVRLLRRRRGERRHTRHQAAARGRLMPGRRRRGAPRCGRRRRSGGFAAARGGARQAGLLLLRDIVHVFRREAPSTTGGARIRRSGRGVAQLNGWGILLYSYMQPDC
jgi:hypothetical protein